jgi:cholesterol oxidase
MNRRLTRRELIIGSAATLGTLAMGPALSGCSTVVSPPWKRKMRPSYDAVVIGSGFGGAVAACRLAHAGLSVAVLERGRRYDLNPFPRNWHSLSAGWFWSSSDPGLFDVRLYPEMTVVQAAGLGGGSLVYANVQMRAPAAVFDHGWPQGYSRAALDPYYDLVAYMLDINPIPKSNLPAKSRAMEAAARTLGRSGQFSFPNLAVDFGPSGVEHQNKFGVRQRGCTYCGECCVGCNFHAKNTLDLNYLAIAHLKGADIATLCEVSRIEPADTGYKVSFKDRVNDGKAGEITARYCFVCAGAVNSTELLLRCRDVHGTLSKLSPRLGDNYSGNGDFLSFAFNMRGRAPLSRPASFMTVSTMAPATGSSSKKAAIRDKSTRFCSCSIPISVCSGPWAR